LALYGNVQVTAQAMATLLEQGVRVVYLSSYGKMRGVVSSGSKQAQLRQEQYRLMSDESANLRLAKAVVEGKIHNQRVLLQRQQRRLSSLNERGAGSVMDQGAFNSALNGMLTMGRSAQQATDSNSLRGFEGKAAAYYFQAIRSMLSPEWGFERRAFYPPPDPFNSLLSFCYSLLTKDVVASVNVVG
ncbi:MAG: CRISPR-associated endonuclease Cas1, partial [Anaerolineales bacterium]|nr:CRISPR-associated endonuclease Cas1 [Anaerolineales bacterium]